MKINFSQKQRYELKGAYTHMITKFKKVFAWNIKLKHEVKETE